MRADTMGLMVLALACGPCAALGDPAGGPGADRPAAATRTHVIVRRSHEYPAANNTQRTVPEKILCWSADGTVLVTGHDGGATGWRAADGAEAYTLAAPAGGGVCGLGTTAGRFVVMDTKAKGRVIDAGTGKDAGTLSGRACVSEDRPERACTPDGRLSASPVSPRDGVRDRRGNRELESPACELMVLDNTGAARPRHLSMVETPALDTPAIVAACFSPDGKRAAAIAQDGGAVVWDVETGAVIGRGAGAPTDDPMDDRGRIARPVFSPDGGSVLVLTGSTLFAWKVGEARFVEREWTFPRAAGTENKPADDAPRERQRRRGKRGGNRFPEPTVVDPDPIPGAFAQGVTLAGDLSADQRWAASLVVTGDKDAARVLVVRLTDLGAGKVVGEFRAPGRRGSIARVSFSPGADRLAVQMSGGAVHIFTLEEAKRLAAGMLAWDGGRAGAPDEGGDDEPAPRRRRQK